MGGTTLRSARAAMPAMEERNPIESGTQFQNRLLCDFFLSEAEALIEPTE